MMTSGSFRGGAGTTAGVNSGGGANGGWTFEDVGDAWAVACVFATGGGGGGATAFATGYGTITQFPHSGQRHCRPAWSSRARSFLPHRQATTIGIAHRP